MPSENRHPSGEGPEPSKPTTEAEVRSRLLNVLKKYRPGMIETGWEETEDNISQMQPVEVEVVLYGHPFDLASDLEDVTNTIVEFPGLRSQLTEALDGLDVVGFLRELAISTREYWNPTRDHPTYKNIKALRTILFGQEAGPRRQQEKQAKSRPPVELRNVEDSVFVLEKEKGALTAPQYNVIKRLVDTFPDGLKIDELEAPPYGGARRVLQRLMNEDGDWARVIKFPGGKGRGGYRLVRPNETAHT